MELSEAMLPPGQEVLFILHKGAINMLNQPLNILMHYNK